MHDKSWESILEKLLLFQNRKAKEILKSLINQPLTKTGAERVRVLIAGKLLMQYPTSDIWHTIWNAIINDNQFGKELLEQANDPDLCNDFLKCLDEIALFYLYIWLVRFYPYLDHEFASDHVRSCRDSVLNELKDRGTYRSCKAIKQIHELMPELDRLKRTLVAAQEIRHSKNWVPPKPRDVLTLCLDSNKRLVKDGNDLINAVMESLNKLEQELQGETPAGQFLWNEIKKNKWRPKNEEVFSDYIKVFLNKDLGRRRVVLGREVEIRKGTGGKIGERTDIHIDAFAQNNEDGFLIPIKLIIEAKGCWNKNVLTDIEDQLVNRYLADNECKLGIYIVGWYDCPQWDDEDYKKADCKKIQMNENQLRNKLIEISNKLSTEKNIMLRSIVINTALR